MLRPVCVALACAISLAACSQPAPVQSAPVAQQAPSAIAEPSESGLAAYQRVCARCHETGVNGAPIAGRPEDWAGRSRLWQAVLFRHAEQGYLGMPARGGDSALTDRDVQAAAEYMLTLTHPRVPAD